MYIAKNAKGEIVASISGVSDFASEWIEAQEKLGRTVSYI